MSPDLGLAAGATLENVANVGRIPSFDGAFVDGNPVRPGVLEPASRLCPLPVSA